jgi:hypothetical protein
MKLAIVGTRSFTNYEAFVREVERILSERKLTPTVIVSGGAKGADALAERYATEKQLPIEVHKPNWKHKGSGKERNKRIVENADFMIAFWDFESKGTQHTISLWRATLKSFEVVNTHKL